jgi:DNA helicase-2/ATP-dependent DNA helicase PcrA
MEFSKAYAALNPRQKEAVDTIDGPVMVVAGPGTGKTQLLSMRVANILRRTDSLPSNILCLTFTESGATAMRQRLVSLIGQAAYKVAIHTFHSFGGEVINHNPQYFYQGAHFRPADELSSYEVLEPIFQQLPHKSPLASTLNGEFTAMYDVKQGIAQLKKASLLPDELLQILDHNAVFLDFAEPILHKAFDVPRLSKKNLADIELALRELEKFEAEPMPVSLFKPLSDICVHELTRALEAAEEASSTTPVTAWRNRWLERNQRRNFVFKDRARSTKLRALSDIYQKYLEGMQERELYDFDDMILRVVHGLETFADLRYNLQEQYQYILVDEFQDTNGAQLRLLKGLTNAEINEGRPNVLVVGDDDQAIYSFQGAEIGNILQFRDLYRDPVTVTLTDNYRSADAILTSARAVITQGSERLEVVLDNVDKTLTAHNSPDAAASELHQFANPTEQYQWVVNQIKECIAAGTSPSEIAVLGRNHRQLLQILPHRTPQQRARGRTHHGADTSSSRYCRPTAATFRHR